MCPNQPAHALQRRQVLLVLSDIVMRGNAAASQQMLKGQQADFGQGSRLRQGQTVLFEQHDRQFLLHLGGGQVRGMQRGVRNNDGHGELLQN